MISIKLANIDIESGSSGYEEPPLDDVSVSQRETVEKTYVFKLGVELIRLATPVDDKGGLRND